MATVKKLNTHEVDTYYIAYTVSTGVYHQGMVSVSEEISTGQNTLESFTTEEEFDAKLAELGVERTYGIEPEEPELTD